MADAATIQTLVSPFFRSRVLDWEKWRYTYLGGRSFIDKFLKRYSSKETELDFARRKELTYSPSFAKAEVNNVKNAIYQRMVDITRDVNCETYTKAINGLDGGVDLNGSTMNRFMGVTVLEELLPMGRVGVYVDMPSNIGTTVVDQKAVRPYLYIYRIEQIKSYTKGIDNEYDTLLLEDNNFLYDEIYNLPYESETAFRFFKRVGKRVTCTFMNANGDETKTVVLDIPKIPFVELELTHSLLEDIADYQISLLNIESSDIAFIQFSNFPFYVEQYDPVIETSQQIRGASTKLGDTTKADGQKVQAEESGTSKEIRIGTTKGRRIAKNLEYPTFLAPPTDSITASMAKQEAMKRDIKLLLNQSLASLKNERSSADSKRADQTGEEEGLSYIGLEMARAELKIAEFWCMYEAVKTPKITISYPNNYELRNYSDRLAEGKTILDLVECIPSDICRRELMKAAATTLLKSRISLSTLQDIHKEIDNAPAAMSIRANDLSIYVEKGMLSKQLASDLLGAPAGDVKIAEHEHVARAEAIAIAQSKAAAMVTTIPAGGSANGVKDLNADPDVDKKAKEQQRDATMNSDSSTGVRGEGKK